MSRPWHRSLLLYLGLPGLLFLASAWVDSMSHESGIEIRKHTVSSTATSLNRDSLRNRNSAVEVTLNHFPHDHSARTERLFIVLPRDPASGGSWWPAPEYGREQEFDSPASSVWILIPHWLLVFLYLGLWSIAFAWRHRRLRHHAADASEK